MKLTYFNYKCFYTNNMTTDNIEVRKKIDTFLQLTEVKIDDDQSFCVWAYILVDNPPPQGIYGMVIFLGAFKTYRQAKKHAKKIVMDSNYNSVFVSRSCSWEELTTESKPDRIKWVSTDRESHIREKARKEYEKEIKQHQKHEKLVKDLEKEKERELDPTTIEHYIHNWYNLIQNKFTIQHYRKLLDEAEQNYQKRADKIRQQYSKQPEFDETWLSILSERLKERDEFDVYETIESNAKLLRPEIFNLSNNNNQVI